MGRFGIKICERLLCGRPDKFDNPIYETGRGELWRRRQATSEHLQCSTRLPCAKCFTEDFLSFARVSSEETLTWISCLSNIPSSTLRHSGSVNGIGRCLFGHQVSPVVITKVRSDNMNGIRAENVNRTNMPTLKWILPSFSMVLCRRQGLLEDPTLLVNWPSVP